MLAYFLLKFTQIWPQMIIKIAFLYKLEKIAP